MKPILAIDLGGTRLKVGLVDPAAGHVLRRRVAPTPQQAADALDLLARIGGELAGDEGLTAVGLSVPGLVDDDGRVVALPGKLDGVVGLDLVARLRGDFGCAAVAVNDAIAFGLGESRFGAGRGCDRVVVVTIGTGVGVAVLEAGRRLGAGALGGGLLGGQIPIFEDPDGPTDTNGKRGTIEARCAAQRIVDAAVRHGCEAADVAAVYQAAVAGGRAAVAGIAAYRADLARALIALAHAHTPSRMILGGGPMVADNPILEGLEERVRSGLWPGYTTEVRVAELGDDAALLGVAALADAGDRVPGDRV